MSKSRSDFLLKLSFFEVLEVVFVSSKNGVPNLEKTPVIANIVTVMIVMVGGTTTERNQPVGTEAEVIATVAV